MRPRLRRLPAREFAVGCQQQFLIGQMVIFVRHFDLAIPRAAKPRQRSS